MKTKREAVIFLQDDCDLYVHPPNISNKDYFKAVFEGKIKVSNYENRLEISYYLLKKE